MKIGIDTTPLISLSKYRGVGTYTKNLLDVLEKYDHDNEYLKLTYNNVSSDLDLLIIPYFFPFKVTLPINKKTKTIITVHDLIPIKFPDEFPRGIRGGIYWFIQRLLLRQADAILTDSLVSKKDIVELCRIASNKIFVVYPVISDKFRVIENKERLNKIRNKYLLPDKYILYVGDCNWSKNLPGLIKAVQNLKVKLVLVGKVFTDNNIDIYHPWNQNLKKIRVMTKNDQNIIKLGYIPEEDLVGVYNLATCYVQPSYYEGFGLSIVEAFACGCPVLSSNGGSLPEIGRDAPLYFNPHHINEIETRIRLIYKDESKRKAMSLKGLKQAKQFSPYKFVKDLNYVFSKIK